MKNLKRGFTLIEMLIVVVIIGILAAALIPRLQSVQGRARDTKRKADIQQIGSASAIYKNDNGSYSGLTLANLAPAYLTALPSDTPGLTTSQEFGAQVVGGYGYLTFCASQGCLILGAKTEVAGTSSNANYTGAALSTILTGGSTITNGTNLQNGAPTGTAEANLRYYYVQ